MVQRINTYFAMLCITVIGAGAALLIIHVAYANHFDVVTSGSAAEYSSLQQSILKM